MDKKYVIVIALLVVAVLGAWALSSRLNSTKVDPVVVEQFGWKIADQGTAPGTTTPRASVALSIAGVDVPLNTYAGTCTAIDGTKVTLLEGEVSGVICMHEGRGQEIGIFADAENKLTLKQGEVVDSSGTLSRTNFVELKKL